MKKIFKKYMDDKIKLDKWEMVGVLSLVIVLCGVFGWAYEVVFYYLNSGMETVYLRGANFLPWINIYATGSILILFFTRKFKKKPWLIFLLSVLITGVLEYFSGYFVLKFTGCRYWDYNTEIWNFLNIDGFICLRSVGFFGVSSLLLMYVIVPFCIYLAKTMNRRTFLIMSITLGALFLFDEFYNLLFARWLNLPRAAEVYKSLGFKYMNYKCGKG